MEYEPPECGNTRLKLIKIAMDEPVPSMKKWGIIRSTQEHILAQLPAMLGVTIYNEKTSADAFARLWELSHYQSSEVSGSTQRTLKSVIGYDKYKHPIYNERVIEFVEKLVESTASYTGSFTPLDLVRELLEREVPIEEWRTNAFTFTKQPVNYEATRQLRERALRVIDRAIYSRSRRIAVLAARSFMAALGDFQPSFRATITPKEQEWQDRERLDVLAKLRRRLDSGDLSLPLVWKIHRILRSIDRSQHQSAVVKSTATVLQAGLPHSDDFELFDVLCINDPRRSKTFPAMQRRPNPRSHAVGAMADYRHRGLCCPRIQVKALEQLLQQAVDAGIRGESCGSVLSHMCRSRMFLEGFSEYALKNPQSIVAANVGIAVGHWRCLDRSEFARYGALFARSENVRIAESIASGVSHGPVEEALHHEDLDILTILAGRTEPGVLHQTIWGLKRLTSVEALRPAALDLIASMKIGDDLGLAREYCDIFGPYGLPATMMTPALAERMLANLVEVEELDDHHFENFMVSVCSVAPGAIVSFLESRITRGVELEEEAKEAVESDYEPIPSSSRSVLRSARNSPEYEDALRRFVDLMKRYPRYEDQISSIFWRMADIWPAEETGTATFAALDRLLPTSHSDDAVIVLRSLEYAPLGLAIFHPMFALHVLWTCAEFGEKFKEVAITRLTGTCFAKGGAQAVQPGTPIMVRGGLSEPWQARVTELLANCEPGSLAFELFKRIADAAQPVFQTLDLGDAFDEVGDQEEE